MKSIRITSIAVAVLIIAACSSSKKNVNTTASTKPATTNNDSAKTTPAATVPVMLAKPSNGVYAPGNEELSAIQVKYKDATLQSLAEGHALYTGVCTNCHGAKNIYNRSEEKWQQILDDMAPKAKITASEKDAVFKYVLAIKAAQPTGAK